MRTYIEAAVMLGLCAVAACDAPSDEARTGTGAGADTGQVADATVAGTVPTTGAACAMVEEAAAEHAVGFDVVMNDNTTGNCVLTPANGDPAAPAFDFRVEPRVSAFDYFSAQADAAPIRGLGDRAVWATLNDMTGYVVVVDGSRAIVTAIAKADGLVPASRRQAEALARLVLAAEE